MTTSTIHEQETAQATPAGTEKRLKAPKKPRVAARKLPASAARAKSRHKASRRAHKQPAGTRPGGSKTAKVLELLQRSGGATLQELMKATGWQPHSVRGFLSGTLGKKRKLTVLSTKVEAGERRYSVQA